MHLFAQAARTSNILFKNLDGTIAFYSRALCIVVVEHRIRYIQIERESMFNLISKMCTMSFAVIVYLYFMYMFGWTMDACTGAEHYFVYSHVHYTRFINISIIFYCTYASFVCVWERTRKYFNFNRKHIFTNTYVCTMHMRRIRKMLLLSGNNENLFQSDFSPYLYF